MCSGYVLAIFNWLRKNQEDQLAQGSEGVCWPHFPNCYESLHVLTAEQIRSVWLGSMALALLVGLIFLAAQKNRMLGVLSYSGLVLVESIRIFFVYFSDFRFWRNQHYMHLLVVLTFLFVPKKRKALTLLIPLFYVFAGILKLNLEWISGAAIDQEMWIFKGPLLPVATTYVVLLELGFIWLLWARTKLLWIVLLQLAIFHLWSYQIVGLYYPALMFGLLAIFLMLQSPQESLTRWRFSDFEHWRQFAPALSLPCLLILVHLYSYAIPGDKALTGEARLLSLNMFDATSECDPHAILKFRGGKADVDLDLHLETEPRLACDPILFLSRAKTLCHNFHSDSQFNDLILRVQAKRSTERNWHQVIDLNDVCQKNPQYSYWGFNDWILKP